MGSITQSIHSRTSDTPRTPKYRGAPRTLCDGLVAEIYLTLDQLDVLAEHTVPRTGSNGVTVWSVDEVWSANEAES